MNQTDYIKERYEKLQEGDRESTLSVARTEAFQTFNRLGIPSVKNEEWKYTRIGQAFNKTYQLADHEMQELTAEAIAAIRLPGYEVANELVFVNGIFAPELSNISSEGLIVQLLQDAAINEFAPIIAQHFNHSSEYLKDGINALNTALLDGGVFVHIGKGNFIEHPVYIYNITNTVDTPVLAQPRSLVYIGHGARVQMVETYASFGIADTMTNQVMEIIVEQDAVVGYYKIQNDAANASQVSSTHIRQTGRSVVNTVTISMNGGIVRNNLHAILEAPYAEAHLYGLYFQYGNSHIDNHTVVDNVAPNCLSNELYKGILDDQSAGVFNGKIFVRKDAQKTNAFQSNKNILLSDTASVNTKPQLEIFADDVKCSHGCTVGQLDTEALFYLQSRGIPQNEAMSLLLQGFAMDIIEKIALAPVRTYVEHLISERLITKHA